VLYFAFFGAFFQKNQYRVSIIANKKALFLAISGLSWDIMNRFFREIFNTP
jgi:hypothetical protein